MCSLLAVRSVNAIFTVSTISATMITLVLHNEVFLLTNDGCHMHYKQIIDIVTARVKTARGCGLEIM
jgi:hypothetical protein